MLFDKIFEKCEACGITIGGLERELKFGHGTIRYWKGGSPSVAKIKRVADFFGCTVDDLLKEE